LFLNNVAGWRWFLYQKKLSMGKIKMEYVARTAPLIAAIVFLPVCSPAGFDEDSKPTNFVSEDEHIRQTYLDRFHKAVEDYQSTAKKMGILDESGNLSKTALFNVLDEELPWEATRGLPSSNPQAKNYTFLDLSYVMMGDLERSTRRPFGDRYLPNIRNTFKRLVNHHMDSNVSGDMLIAIHDNLLEGVEDPSWGETETVQQFWAEIFQQYRRDNGLYRPTFPYRMEDFSTRNSSVMQWTRYAHRNGTDAGELVNVLNAVGNRGGAWAADSFARNNRSNGSRWGFFVSPGGNDGRVHVGMTKKTYERYVGKGRARWNYVNFLIEFDRDIGDIFSRRDGVSGANDREREFERFRSLLMEMNEFMHLHAFPDGVGRTYLVWLQFECLRNGWPLFSTYDARWEDLHGVRSESEILESFVKSMELSNRLLKLIHSRPSAGCP
jgi:hypothetical protein